MRKIKVRRIIEKVRQNHRRKGCRGHRSKTCQLVELGSILRIPDPFGTLQSRETEEQIRMKRFKKLEMCPVGTRMPRQGVMSVTQNDFGEMIYR